MNESQKKIWIECDAVVFDVDSTLITSEGLDDLAAYCGVGKQVAELTRQAMGEGLSFKEALTQRLKLLYLTKPQLEKFLNSNPHNLTPGVKNLVDRLHQLRKNVYLVSGGFHSIIQPIARTVNIPDDYIYANKFVFNNEDILVGFDETQPTSCSGGKTKVIEQLIEKYGYKSIVTIGDGMTDLETYPPAKLFIGFGGNVIRKKVLENSPCFIYDFQDLTSLLCK